MATSLDRALALIGPLEGRIMRAVWETEVGPNFTVRDVHGLMPDLAYTTVMSTVVRLADKGLLAVDLAAGHQRAHVYSVELTPDAFLVRSGDREVQSLVDRLGDVALAAFANRLDELTQSQRERLRRLGGR